MKILLFITSIVFTTPAFSENSNGNNVNPEVTKGSSTKEEKQQSAPIAKFFPKEQEEYLYQELVTLQLNPDEDVRNNALANLEGFVTDVNINQLTSDLNRTMLFHAANNIAPHNAQSIQFVTHLLSLNADANIADKDNVTPLHEAVKSGSLELVKLLIEKGGADIKAEDKFGRTASSIAVFMKKDTIEEYLDGVLIEKSENNGNSLLHIAAFSNSVEAAKALISDNFDVNLKNESGDTPLHLAANYGSYETAEILLENNADVSTVNNELKTPLHLASSSLFPYNEKTENGKRNIARLLMRKNSVISAKDKDGGTPLHWASFSGKRDVVVSLIFYGAEVDASDANGLTPLELAQSAGQSEIIEILVNNSP